MTRFGQAIQRLELQFGHGVVRVGIGDTVWFCTTSAFSDASKHLAAMPVLDDVDGRAGEVLAYDELRQVIAGPIISIDGGPARGSAGARRMLAQRARAAGLLVSSADLNGRAF